jgi:hypothetical protein
MPARQRLIVGLGLAIAGLSGCSSEASAPVDGTSATTGAERAQAAVDPIPVVVDYSPTVSDVDALLFLAANPHVDLAPVTSGRPNCATTLPGSSQPC